MQQSCFLADDVANHPVVSASSIANDLPPLMSSASMVTFIGVGPCNDLRG